MSNKTILFSADGNYEVRYKSNVLIYPNGEVLWVPPAIYQVSSWTKRLIFQYKIKFKLLIRFYS